tara:strand:- start:3655 stop:4851 length:1197 start_codon:yes stop_codon:yes gene_type:complete
VSSAIDYNFRTKGNDETQGNSSSKKEGTLEPARVIDIIMDKDHPEYELFGGPNSIGMVYYRFISQEGLDLSEDGESEYTGTAFPLTSSNRLLPLKNEIVFLTVGPDPLVDEGSGLGRHYYTTPYAIWNHPHHNAIPVKTEDKPEKVNIGTGIEQNDKIAPLQPFPGDYIIEGRLGQTIRFAGGITEDTPFTDESNSNKPLIIISNGQKQAENGFQHIIEDINEDPSSIYLTSNNTIPLTLANDKRKAYDTPPDNPSNYQGSQLLFNSDRVTINARQSDILMSSATSIGLNSNTVNIDGKDYMCIDADKIYLGSKARTNQGASKQPVVLGHRLEAYLGDIIDQLISISKALGKAKTVKGDPIPTINLRGASAQIVLKSLKNQLNPRGNSTLKSKKTFVE